MPRQACRAATAVAEANRDIADLEIAIADVRSDVRLLTRMVGAVIALGLGIFANAMTDYAPTAVEQGCVSTSG